MCKATLSMQVNIDCPKCLNEFNILETCANEDGEIIEMILVEKWEELNIYFEVALVCPECSAEFNADGIGIEWGE